MAHFYAEIQGNRGAASRMGTKSSGMWSHTRGWNIGVDVRCGYDATKDKDFVDVYITNGSGGYGSSDNAKYIGRFYDGEVNPVVELIERQDKRMSLLGVDLDI